MGILDLISSALKPKPHSDLTGKCPKCGINLNMGMERCPKCGTHIETMFRLECPKCKTANSLKADRCSKCGYPLSDQPAPAGRDQYRCPMCGYVADYYMMSCPSCGVKFV
jgi:ribosomal protein L40E